MVKRSFIETLRDLRQIWLDDIDNLTELPLQAMLTDLANIERNIKQCLALPQTCEPETVVLINRTLPLVERIGRFDRWITLTCDALAKCTTLPSPLAVDLLLTLGTLYNRMNNWQAALRQHEEAAARAKASGSDEQLVIALFHLCADYRAGGMLDRAEASGQTALQLAGQTAVDKLLLSRIWSSLGMVYFFKGSDEDLANAENHLRKAINLLPADETLFKARQFNNLALILKSRNSIDEARKTLERARATLENTTYELDKSRVLTSLGSIYFEIEEWRKAETLFREAYSQSLAHSDDLYLRAMLDQNIGNVLFRQGDYKQAEWMLGQAIKLWEVLQREIDLANSLGIMGELYALQNRDRDAIHRYERAIALLKPQAAQRARAKRLLGEFETSLARLKTEEG